MSTDNVSKITKPGERLRQLRKEQHLPLRKVAALLDIDVAILSKMERGERKLTKAIVEKLAKIYNHDREELMVLYLSRKILDEVGAEDLAHKALIAAEKEIQYKPRHRKNPGSVQEKKKITRRIQQYFQSQTLVSKAWLFGSFARGDDTRTSDIDIIIDVAARTKFTLFDLAEVQEQVQKIVSGKADIVMLKGIRPEMKTRIGKDMLLIYETR